MSGSAHVQRSVLRCMRMCCIACAVFVSVMQRQCRVQRRHCLKRMPCTKFRCVRVKISPVKYGGAVSGTTTMELDCGTTPPLEFFDTDGDHDKTAPKTVISHSMCMNTC